MEIFVNCKCFMCGNRQGLQLFVSEALVDCSFSQHVFIICNNNGLDFCLVVLQLHEVCCPGACLWNPSIALAEINRRILCRGNPAAVTNRSEIGAEICSILLVDRNVHKECSARGCALSCCTKYVGHVSWSLNYWDYVIMKQLHICSTCYRSLPNCCGGLDSWASIATGWTVGVWLPAGARIFSFLHSVQTSSGAQPASWPMGSGGSFCGSRAAGSWR
jgi:hypothetical protein